MTAERRDIPLARTILLVVAIVVGLNVMFLLVRALVGREVVDGPAGSSFVTTGQGTAALFELYERNGLDPVQKRVSPARETVSPSDVFMQITSGAAQPDEATASALRTFVANGGRLVIAGLVPDEYIEEITGESAEWTVERLDGAASQVFPDVPAVGPIPIEAPVLAIFVEPGPWVPWYVLDDGRFPVLQLRVGRGDVIWISDGSYFSNARLAIQANSSFALALADGRTPVFDEVIHGYGETGQSIPDAWTVAFWLGLATALVALVAYGWRSGPPEEVTRDLGPRRADYVDAVGSLLARSPDSAGALEPIRRTAVRVLGAESLDEEGQLVAARRQGLTDDEARALLADDDADPADVGLAFVKLYEQTKEKL